MPKYSYKCADCNNEFDLVHSMTETAQKCIVCGLEGGLKRLPSFSFSISKPNGNGKLVKEFIENTRGDIEQEKQNLKQDYKE